MPQMQPQPPDPTPTVRRTPTPQMDASAESSGPDGPAPPDGPAALMVLLAWARQELLETARRARIGRNRVAIAVVGLFGIAVVAVATGLAVDEPAFWSSAGAVFVAALTAVITYAARELGMAGTGAAGVAEGLPETQPSAMEVAARTTEAIAEEIYAGDPVLDALFADVVGDVRPALISEAARLFERAADAGRTGAMCNLARIHSDRGDGAKAEEWYERAARAGEILGAYRLGALHTAHGAPIHPAKWWSQRAGDGSAVAAYLAGQADYRSGTFSEDKQPVWAIVV